MGRRPCEALNFSGFRYNEACLDQGVDRSMSKPQTEKIPVRTVTPKDLPLSCPPKDQALWDMHPRVYLPIEAEGQVVCPYCSAHYVLKK